LLDRILLLIDVEVGILDDDFPEALEGEEAEVIELEVVGKGAVLHEQVEL